MDAQEWIVGIIVCLCLVGLARHILHSVRRMRGKNPPCEGCGGGCGGCCFEKKDDSIEKTLDNACRFKK